MSLPAELDTSCCITCKILNIILEFNVKSVQSYQNVEKYMTNEYVALKYQQIY